MDKKYYIIVVILVASYMVFLLTSKVNNEKIKNYLGDYDFSVGTVEVYFNRGTIGSNVGVSSVTYSYMANGIRYINNYDALFYKLPSSPNIGDKFVVAFNKNDPQKSILLGDCLIRTDNDFEFFINRYKNDNSNYDFISK